MTNELAELLREASHELVRPRSEYARHLHDRLESAAASLEAQEPVVTVMRHEYTDGNHPENGFSNADWARIESLEPGTKLYRHQPTSAVAEWIPVAERLPEDGILVMVYTPGDDGRIDFDSVEDGRWVSHEDHYEHFIAVGGYSLGGDDCSVTGPGPEAPYTHWMPLPAAPQQGGGEDE